MTEQKSLPYVPLGTTVTIIVAVAEDGVIGHNGRMPWGNTLAHDLRRFMQYTMGKDVIVGRKTFNSMRPLKGRHTIIVSKRMFAHEGCTVASSLKDALGKTKMASEIFVAGGAQIYREALPVASRLLITHVLAKYEGDTFFPKWNTSAWRQTCAYRMCDGGIETCFEAWERRQAEK